MEDPAALEIYRDYSPRIDQHFNGLRRRRRSRRNGTVVDIHATEEGGRETHPRHPE
jgi:hypothetical protein